MLEVISSGALRSDLELMRRHAKPVLAAVESALGMRGWTRADADCQPCNMMRCHALSYRWGLCSVSREMISSMNALTEYALTFKRTEVHTHTRTNSQPHSYRDDD